MIIAGWILALLGLAQIVYASSMDIAQAVPGNRLLGVAPSLVANADLVAQRGMIDQAGLVCFLAGAVFLAAAYLKPAPEQAGSKSWTTTAALSALALTVAALIGFAVSFHHLRDPNPGRKLADEGRLRQADAETAARLLGPAGSSTAGTPPSGTVIAPSSEPAD